MRKNFITLISMISFILNDNHDISPQFSDYQTPVYSSPFAKSITISKDQELFSYRWKKAMRRELNKSVNFAGHYRVTFTSGGSGKECLKESWISGWVIDKVTGQIVSGLPKDHDGSDNPLCKSAVFNFENNKLKKLVESKEGCNIDE